MAKENNKPEIIDESGDKYKYGFVTDIAADTAPRGLSEDIIRLISAKKGEPEWLLERRLKAFEFWKTTSEPSWAKLTYDKINYQDLYYYSAPKQKAAPQSLEEVDPELLETYAKLGIPLKEQEALAGVVAVDAAWRSAAMAMEGVYIHSVHGINGSTPEQTMRNMGQIASPGMVGTEKTIIEILEGKSDFGRRE